MAQRALGSPGVTGEMGSTEALRGAMRPRSPSQLSSKGPRQGHRSSLKALGGVCFSAEVVATLLQDDPHGGLFVVERIGGGDGMDQLALRIREQGAGPRRLCRPPFFRWAGSMATGSALLRIDDPDGGDGNYKVAVDKVSAERLDW